MTEVSAKNVNACDYKHEYSAIIVGTGLGGISAAINLLRLGINDFVMLERRDFAGGTWLQNTYPGAAVDVQSPLYSLSGHPFPWSHLFAKQDELAEYTRALLDKYDLHKHMQLQCQVRSAIWKENSWQLTLANQQTLQCKMLINATGPLSSPSTPSFANFDSYKGPNFHSNDWQHNIELDNKNVAIIGSGASAVQIIPAIIDRVKSLHVVQRTPHWVLPRPDWKIPKALRKFMALKPIYAVVRCFIYWLLELRVIAFKYSPRLLELVAAKPALRHLKKQVTSESLRKTLTPSFIIGCKRIIISNTFYPALQKSNCFVHDKYDGVSHFYETGINFKKSGNCKIDVVIFATGYNAIDSMVSYEVKGRNNAILQNRWNDYPRAYLGTSIPDFPNFFVVTGPNTGIGHTSAIFVIESQMRYIMRCVEEVLVNGAVSIEPTELAEDNYSRMVHEEMAKTVWSYGNCESWYQNAKGKVIAMFPGFSFTFRRLCKAFKYKHHLIKR